MPECFTHIQNYFNYYITLIYQSTLSTGTCMDISRSYKPKPAIAKNFIRCKQSWNLARVLKAYRESSDNFTSLILRVYSLYIQKSLSYRYLICTYSSFKTSSKHLRHYLWWQHCRTSDIVSLKQFNFNVSFSGVLITYYTNRLLKIPKFRNVLSETPHETQDSVTFFYMATRRFLKISIVKKWIYYNNLQRAFSGFFLFFKNWFGNYITSGGHKNFIMHLVPK